MAKSTCTDDESFHSSIVESTSETNSEMDIHEAFGDSQHYTKISELPINNEILSSNIIKKQLADIAPLPTFNNISISNSTDVVFGNVIKVKGVLNINVYNGESIKQDQNDNNETVFRRRESPKNNHTIEPFYSNDACLIIPRSCWLALEPLEEYKLLEGPVDIIIICHTGSEMSKSTERNMEILRNIQTFHIDTQCWDDIGYNFLIGCDGNIYEGRGWGVVGVHTFGYNSKSIGIAFIGSFSCSLPTEKALKACKELLKRGTDKGFLTDDYKILGHRQCINSASPGRFLYEEIKKWDHFYDKNDQNP